MASRREVYFVFMNYDPEYERLKSNRTKKGTQELDLYLCKKHDELLENTLEPGSYNKRMSLVIVDGFAVEITDNQANVLRSAKDVRVVEKNQELA
ncbi:PREDICTED: subtilisin-like protease SBT2.4 [Nicotiana attenuata]|uniref:Uncharacterized protein n=1 Tax=Nicotiana attenuata TaxID=49451 RepID=A0A1J6KEI0_NICAT|nr:PREDICTED: subtilisin-like protease SBT2.4 [Nicotiana attenuata]OIT27798.1 hypothetical protein A4A49_64928 [Nicotiana attenuata]